MRLHRQLVRAPARRPARQLVVGALVAALGVLAVAPEARALHTDEQRITVDTAETLSAGEWVLGLWRIELGIVDALDVSTFWLPWFAPAPNVHLKWRLWHDERWAFALRPAVFWMKLGAGASADQTDSQATLFVVPLEIAGTWRFHPRLSWSLQTVYTTIGVSGTYDASDFEGIAAVSNLQFATTLEWRATRVTALYLHARVVAFQDLAARASVDVQLDDFTTAEIHGALQSDVVDVSGGASAVLGAVLSWEHFNLRVGAGYGYWSLPGINLVIPRKTPIAELDLFWRL